MKESKCKEEPTKKNSEVRQKNSNDGRPQKRPETEKKMRDFKGKFRWIFRERRRRKIRLQERRRRNTPSSVAVTHQETTLPQTTLPLTVTCPIAEPNHPCNKLTTNKAISTHLHKTQWSKTH